MSLPAGQQRVLHGIEGALKASEPQLASMFAIFVQLHQDEPVGAEPLKRGRLSWSRPGTAMSAIVLIPVMFAAVVIGALLSGSAAAGTAAAGDSACTTAVPAPRFTTVGSDSLAVPPLARAGTGTAHPPRMC